jgi:hypothetical protein
MRPQTGAMTTRLQVLLSAHLEALKRISLRKTVLRRAEMHQL